MEAWTTGPPPLHHIAAPPPPEKAMAAACCWKRGCHFFNGVTTAERDEKRGSRGDGWGLQEDNRGKYKHNVLSPYMELSRKAQVASGEQLVVWGSPGSWETGSWVLIAMLRANKSSATWSLNPHLHEILEIDTHRERETDR